jgi:hypothetical protein
LPDWKNRPASLERKPPHSVKLVGHEEPIPKARRYKMRGLGSPMAVVLIIAGVVTAGETPEKSKGTGEGAKAEAKKAAGKAEAAAEKGANAEGKKEETAEEPAFKNDKAKASFDKGKDFFELATYREALNEMNKAKAQVKSKEDGAIMERWIQACKGGIVLEAYKKSVEKGIMRKPFLDATENLATFKGTPIYERLSAFADELRPKVAFEMDTFDAPSRRHTPEQGKQFVSDPSIVFRGANCILWTSTRTGKKAKVKARTDDQKHQIQIKTIPARWSGEYHSVVFWVRMEQPAEIMLIALNPGKVAQGGETNMKTFTPTIQSRKGWVMVEAPLDQFKSHGAGTFGNVEKFILTIEGKTAFKIYVDELLLMRKDPAEARSAVTDEDDDKKSSTKKKATTSSGKIKQTERKNK